jgi:hypothetical protein
MQFLEYAVKNRIIVMNYPSHSTHSLQSLDVGIFSPLSTAYSSELCQQQQRSQGLLPVKKPDLYGIVKRAWASTRLYQQKPQHRGGIYCITPVSRTGWLATKS